MPACKKDVTRPLHAAFLRLHVKRSGRRAVYSRLIRKPSTVACATGLAPTTTLDGVGGKATAGRRCAKKTGALRCRSTYRQTALIL